jgi:hypothetical protein
MSKGDFLSLQISQEDFLQAANLTNKSFNIIENSFNPIIYGINIFMCLFFAIPLSIIATGIILF